MFLQGCFETNLVSLITKIVFIPSSNLSVSDEHFVAK